MLATTRHSQIDVMTHHRPSNDDGMDSPAAVVETKIGEERRADAPPPPRKHVFRLLLHGRDGCIPYLTPELMRLVFCPAVVDGNCDVVGDGPSSSDDDDDWKWLRRHFILGVAAKDTCVTAMYRDRDSSKKKRNDDDDDFAGKDESERDRSSKRTRGEPQYASGVTTTATVQPDSATSPSIMETTSNGGTGAADAPREKQCQSKKPCGYSFIDPSQTHRICTNINSHADRKDANGGGEDGSTSDYMHSYLRIPKYISTMIVPTFSLDHPSNGEECIAEGGVNNRNRHSPKMQGTNQHPNEQKQNQQRHQKKKDVIPNSTKDSMLVDTPHGWQKLSPVQYWGAVSSLTRPFPSAWDSDTPGTALESSCVGAVGLFDHFGIPRGQLDDIFAEYPNDANNGSSQGGTNTKTPAHESLLGAASPKGKWGALLQRLVQRTNEWSLRIATHRRQTRPSISFWTPLHVAASQLPLDSLLSCPASRCSRGGKTRQNIASDCGHVAFVGWDAISSSRESRRMAVRSLMTTMRSSPSPQRQYLVLSVIDLQSILDAAKEGISIIGTDLVRQWSRNGKALCLDLTYDDDITEHDERSARTMGGLIELRGEQYASDSSALHPGCKCIACRPLVKSLSKHDGICNHITAPSFSRAYIHHLIKAKEMLAETLLFVHNLHRVLLLLRQMSRAASLDAGDSMHTGRTSKNLENLCNRIEEQL